MSLPWTAFADDRDLLRQSSGNPYVFILFDTSGSMNWTPQCTQAQFNAGNCDVLCPTGDCFAPRNADDPSSKFYQAKEALYEVLNSTTGVHFGFATYNQDELVVTDKHWLYEASATDYYGNSASGVTLVSGRRFPAVGDEEVFGDTWSCDEGSGFDEIGCYARDDVIASMGDPVELRRAHRLPKLGRNMNESVTIYLQDHADGRRYEFIYRPVSYIAPGVRNEYGNEKFAAEIELRLCTNNKPYCNSSFRERRTIYYDLVGDFIAWDIKPKRSPPEDGFFSPDDNYAEDTCDGWDGNDDENSDPYPNSYGYNLRWPTDSSDTRDDPEHFFDFGDVIPLDWNDDHQADVLSRLGPGGNFGVAPHFEDERRNYESYLRLKSSNQRPLVANGSTPLGNSIRDFRTWYSGCDHGNCRDDGWADIAAEQDPDWACRKKYLLIITDGDDTCPGTSACSGTASLRSQTGVKTYVVAYGVANGSGNALTCMAANGGTGAPIYPQNKTELVQALTDIFGEIQVEARSFASASVPTVQNETADKIYLSSFTPLPDVAVWPGRIDAFRKPLPLKEDDTPDFDRDCAATGVEASCHLWEAGEMLKLQAPSPTEAALGYLKLGSGLNERRVLYAKEPNPNDLLPDVPTPLRLFNHPSGEQTKYDLWRGLGLIPQDAEDDSLSYYAELTTEIAARKIIGNALKIKTEILPDPDGLTDDLIYEYVLGDIFHADPLIISSPNHLRYFRQDLNDYRDFAKRHFWRRKMLVVAANDGQLHFFDAGVRTQLYDPTSGDYVPRFSDGTGREIFAYMPRLTMSVVGDQFAGSEVSAEGVAGDHIYSLDGVGAVADVYVDPLHNGTNHREEDRGWRTVLISGLREGGNQLSAGTVSGFVSGYFALDVTQPDRLFTPTPSPTDPDPDPYPVPEGQVVPSCLQLSSHGDQLDSSQCPSPGGSDFHFPAELWTFTDRIGNPNNSDRSLFSLDEDDNAFPLNPSAGLAPTPDGNGYPDLGDTWSKPVIGQIKVCAGSNCDPLSDPNDVESRFVAIFGGGLDTQSANAARRGNWLYMVDVETGQAIYKRQVDGSVPAGLAVLDRDQDGFLDIIYVPTTTGYLYKVDLTALTALGDVPVLEDVRLNNSYLVGSPLPSSMTITVERVIDPVWDPFPIFSTGGRPIYMTPTAFYVAERDQYALAFGTGNRANLWERNGVEGRFYTFVDEDFERLDIRPLPYTESNYEQIEVDEDNLEVNLLVTPEPGRQPGWVLLLDADDRVITQAFVVVSVMVFTNFSPFQVAAVDQNGNPTEACARSGTSQVFVVDATNGDAFTDLDDQSDTVERFLTVGDFTTAPYIDQTATKNPIASGAGGRDAESALDTTQMALQDAIREALKQYFPEGCRYNDSFSLTVNASRSDTGFVRYATIPIAICPVDWKVR